MESFNLKTASNYINNLLLARGLLRNGTPIEFAHPSKGEGGKEATLAQIINLVHDMVLKRDREQEQRETVAHVLRTLRTEAAEHTSTISKSRARNEELARQLALAQASERAAKAALKTSETQIRTLREESARLKTSVNQIRASCTNDIRKRDVQIQRLKSHLTEQQRGNRSVMSGATITITPGASTSDRLGKSTAANNAVRSQGNVAVDDPAYTLRQETTDFLTELSQNLSDENDGLIGIVRNSLATLRELQGMPENAVRAAHPHGAPIVTADQQAGQGLPTSCEALAREMDGVLENLQSILTNPNFVPIEEVASREEEILRLREGWERMESRWQEAVGLMDGWRQRMLEGDTVNLEDLRQGMGLGMGLDAVTELEEEYGDADQEAEPRSEDLDQLLDEIVEAKPMEPEESVVAVNKVQRGQPTTRGAESTLQPRNENRSNMQTSSPRKAAQSSARAIDLAKRREAIIADENSEVDLLPSPTITARDSPASRQRSTRHDPTVARADSKDLHAKTQDATSLGPRRVRFIASSFRLTPNSDASVSSLLSPSLARRGRCASSASRAPRNDHGSPNDEIKVSTHHPRTPRKNPTPHPLRTSSQPDSPYSPLMYLFVDPLQSLKRHSSPTRHPDAPSPKMTIQEKLNVARAEAEAAAVAAGLRLDDVEIRVDEGSFLQEGVQKVPLKGSPSASASRRKSGMKGRARRRKSTLTPEELERLMNF